MTNNLVYLVVTPAGDHHYFGSLAAIYAAPSIHIDVSINTLYRHKWKEPYTTRSGFIIRRGEIQRKTKADG